MTQFLIRCWVIFTFVILSLFSTVQMTDNYRNKKYDIVSLVSKAVDGLQTEDAEKVLTFVGCNFWYHAILHVHLSHTLLVNPPDDVVQHCSLNPFHEWSKKMLVFMSHSSKTRSMMRPMWVFFLYTYRMDEHLFNRKRVTDEVFESIYKEAFEILRGELQTHCPVLRTPGKGQRTYESYIADVMKENDSSTYLQNVKDSHALLDLIIDPVASLRGDNMFSDDDLFLSNVMKDTKVVDTLITEFKLIPEDSRLGTLTISNYKEILDPNTTLQTQILLLYKIHYSFLAMLNIMMLRLCIYHLADVKRSANYMIRRVPLNRRSWYMSVISDKLKEFIRLLGLTDNDQLTLFSTLFDREDIGKIKLIEEISDNGIYILRNQCDSLDMKRACRSTNTMVFPIKEVIGIADSIGIVIKMKSTFYDNTILYAEIFIEYLKKKLSGIDFSIIYLFMNTIDMYYKFPDQNVYSLTL